MLNSFPRKEPLGKTYVFVRKNLVLNSFRRKEPLGKTYVIHYSRQEHFVR